MDFQRLTDELVKSEVLVEKEYSDEDLALAVQALADRIDADILYRFIHA